jgi:hypothetical protein
VPFTRPDRPHLVPVYDSFVWPQIGARQ